MNNFENIPPIKTLSFIFMCKFNVDDVYNVFVDIDTFGMIVKFVSIYWLFNTLLDDIYKGPLYLYCEFDWFKVWNWIWLTFLLNPDNDSA
jgi:hypothetical protein